MDREIEITRKTFTSFLPTHPPAADLWTALVNSGPSWLPRAQQAPDTGVGVGWELPPRSCSTSVTTFSFTHFSELTWYVPRVIQTMWKNGLHVFVFALLSYLEGRPAVLPRNAGYLGTGPVSWLGLPEACGLKSVMIGRLSSLGTSAPSVPQVPSILAPSIRASTHGSSTYLCLHGSPFKTHPLLKKTTKQNHIHSPGEVTPLASSPCKTDQLDMCKVSKDRSQAQYEIEAESHSTWGRVGKRHLEMIPWLSGSHCKNNS